ncbi:MAG: SpoIIIAC/SpoIIIAD family protein [Oscillospiraceae bacterium]
MNLFSIFGIALVATALCIIFKQYKPEYALVISIISGILIFTLLLINLKPIFEVIQELMLKARINGQYSKAIIKTLGICYITQLACDSCKDAGESSIAQKVELAGKVSIVIIALPLFENLVSIATKLIQG